MRELDLDRLHIRALANASYEINLGHASQLVYIIIPCDKDDNSCILYCTSYNSRRVSSSILGAETYAFADAYDFAYRAKKDLKSLFKHNILLTIFTESKSLFGVITKCSRTQEKRFTIDHQAERDAF